MQTHSPQQSKQQAPLTVQPKAVSGDALLQRVPALEEEELLQGKFEEGIGDPESRTEVPPIQRQVNNTGLPDNLKSGIENLSGYSMDDVKVYYNSDQPAQLNAHAYAQGSDIHVAPGQERHLPHEAWHVVQQKQGRVRPTMQLKGKVNINDDGSLEREADVMGARAVKPSLAEGVLRQSDALQDITQAPVQRYEKTATVFKQVVTQDTPLLSALDIADQREVDLAAEAFAAKYEEDEVYELGGDHQVDPEKDYVIVVAHGTAGGTFADKDPKDFARFLKEQHNVQAGATIWLEGCYSGKTEEGKKADTSSTGRGARRKKKRRGASANDGDNSREKINANTFLALFGEEMDKEGDGAFTNVAGNPGVAIYHKSEFGNVFLKEGATAMVFSDYRDELRELDKTFSSQIRLSLKPLKELNREQAEDVGNILSKKENEKIVRFSNTDLGDYSPPKIAKIFNRDGAKLKHKRHPTPWANYLNALFHADVTYPEGYQPKSENALSIFDICIRSCKLDLETHEMATRKCLDEHMEKMFKYEDKK